MNIFLEDRKVSKENFEEILKSISSDIKVEEYESYAWIYEDFNKEETLCNHIYCILSMNGIRLPFDKYFEDDLKLSKSCLNIFNDEDLKKTLLNETDLLKLCNTFYDIGIRYTINKYEEIYEVCLANEYCNDGNGEFQFDKTGKFTDVYCGF